MKILSVAAECAPFAKIGGLADVVAALPNDWQELGHENLIVIPKYRDIDTSRFEITPSEYTIAVPMGSWMEYARLWFGTLPGTAVRVCFLESADYFDRKGIYGNPEGFNDNDRRFIFLSRAVFEVARALGFKPDIVHAHDYHTAFAMAFLKTHYRFDPLFSSAAGVYTIHNMAHQGQSDQRRVMPWAQLSLHNFKGSWFEHDGVLNMMKAGLMFADKITTVSPTYASEIRYSTKGEGMQDYVNMRAADFMGVLNGADYKIWDPETDIHLSVHYTAKSLEKKRELKRELLNNSVPAHDLKIDLPLFGMVSRLTEQKGISLLEKVMEPMLRSGRMRFLILGSGDKKFERFLTRMGQRYPTRALIKTGYSEALSHTVIASSDFLMVPSLFEPCGLTQIYALKYGTVPVVRATGGLADTVKEFSPQNGSGTGFVFHQYSASDFQNALLRAASLYGVQPFWDTVRLNGMACNYSSRDSAERYINVCSWALEKVPR